MFARMRETEPSAGLRPFFTSLFVPSAIFGLGTGAGAPMMALLARDLGASVPVAGMIVGMIALGAVLGDLPSGSIVGRFGEQRAIIGGTVLGATGVLVSLLAPNPAILAVGAVLTGFAMAVWGLARQSYLAGALPIHMRARGISANAAMHRAGFLVGPFVGAVAVHRFGIQGGLMVEFVAIIVAGILITRSTVPEPQRSDRGGVGVLGVARSHHVVLLTLGAGSMLVGASRASREAVLPLWAEHIGVAPATVALVFGISGAVDLLLAYPAGVLMDKCGRLVTAIPALLLFGTAFLILPLIHELWWLIVVAVVLGAGNGMSNGLVMTLGADVSPRDRRAEFLAAWRLTHDTGSSTGPLVVGAVATVSLAAGAMTIGALGVVGAAVMWRYIPRYVPSPRSRLNHPDMVRP